VRDLIHKEADMCVVTLGSSERLEKTAQCFTKYH